MSDSFDDRLRRHLHETGADLPVGAAQLGAVRARARARARRQTAVAGALGCVALTAIVGLSLVMLSSGSGDTDEPLAAAPTEVIGDELDAGSVDAAAPTATISPSTAAEDDSGAPVSTSPGLVEPDPSVGDDEVAEQLEDGALAAATSTTTALSTARWVQVMGPGAAPAEGVDFRFASGQLLARYEGGAAFADGEGWRSLPQLPTDLTVLAVTVGEDGRARLTGWVSDGPCRRQPVAAMHDGASWVIDPIPLADPAGVIATPVVASIAATPSTLAVSRVDELSVDPTCVLAQLELEGSSADLRDGSLVYLDSEGVETTLGPTDLAAAGFDPLALTLLSGPQRRSTLSWLALQPPGQWTMVDGPVGVVAPEPLAGVVAGRLIAQTPDGLLSELPSGMPVTDGSDPIVRARLRPEEAVWWTGTAWFAWDGAAVTKHDPVLPEGATALYDAVRTPDGDWVVLSELDAQTVVSDPTGTQQVAAMSGVDAGWGTLGLVAGQVHLVTESPIGPAVFRLEFG